MKLLLFIIFTLSACTSQRGKFQDDIPADKLDCQSKYVRCIQLKKIKDTCDKDFDDCDLKNYDKSETEDVDLD